MRKNLKEGTIVFLSSGPLYAVVVNREYWLKAARIENEETVQDFLEIEKDQSLIAVPLLVLGDVVASKISSDKLRMEKYLKRWAYTNLESHLIVMSGIDELLSFTIQALLFCKSDYLEAVRYESLTLYDYFTCPERNLPPGDNYSQMFELFKKALPR